MNIDIICRLAETADEVATCMEIRHRVFVLEQRLFPATERDEHDARALHLAAFSSGRIIGTVRVYADERGAWWGGRLAVLKRYRGRAGRELVQAAVDLVRRRGAVRFFANIQIENLNFFKNMGWRQSGDEFLLHGRQHVLMEALLR